jgi:hypothetical protein
MFGKYIKSNYDTRPLTQLLLPFKRIKFQENYYFSHTYVCLNKKPCLDFFCEITWVDLSCGVEMVWLTHMEYIFCGSCLNHKTTQSHSNQLCHLGFCSGNSCECIYVKVKISHFSLGFMLESFTRCWWSHGQRSRTW